MEFLLALASCVKQQSGSSTFLKIKQAHDLTILMMNIALALEYPTVTTRAQLTQVKRT